MKKKYYLYFFTVVFFLSACGKDATAEPQSGIAKTVQEFYGSGYDYEKETVSYDTSGGETEEVLSVVNGQIFTDPYREHMTVESGDGNGQLWTEAYFEEEKNGIRAVLLTKDGETEQMTTRTMPYGYGETVTYTQADNVVNDDTEYEVYEGAYTVDIGNRYRLSEELDAAVTQEYYINSETGTLYRICTDTTDLNRKNAAAVDVSANGTDLETALKEAEKNCPGEKEILTIQNYGNPTEFEIP